MAAGVQVLWSPNEPSVFATYSNELKLYNVLDAEVRSVSSCTYCHIALAGEKAAKCLNR